MRIVVEIDNRHVATWINKPENDVTKKDTQKFLDEVSQGQIRYPYPIFELVRIGASTTETNESPGTEEYRVIQEQVDTLRREDKVIRAFLSDRLLSDEDRRTLIYMYLHFSGITPSSSFFSLHDVCTIIIKRSAKWGPKPE